jgi:hypothetical protein
MSVSAQLTTVTRPAAGARPGVRTSSVGLGVCLLVLLAWGALAFGAVYPWAYWPLAVAAALVGTWGIIESEAWRHPRTKGLAIALAAVATAMAVQVVPLPSAVVGWVSPGVEGFFQRYQFGYEAPAFRTLSIAPVHTWTALGLFAAFALLLLGLSRTIRNVSLSWLMGGLIALGVLLALIGIVQRGLIDEVNPLVYGFWKPYEGGRVFGPFINRNHFAGWMLLVLPVIVGYSCGVVHALRLPARRRWSDWLHWATSVEASRFLLAAGAIMAMAAALVLTQSRSGLLGFACGLAVIAGFVLVRARKTSVRAAALLYFGALLVGAVMLTGAGRTIDRVATATTDTTGRLSAWRDTMEIAADFPIAGTGLGTFANAMLVYQSGPRHLMYAQAHNDYLQLVAEGGLLVTLPALAVLAGIVLAIRRRLAAGDDDPVTSWVRVGAVGALAAIAVQSLMEFSLQMPGNTVMFVFVLALAMHRPRRSSRADRI